MAIKDKERELEIIKEIEKVAGEISKKQKDKIISLQAELNLAEKRLSLVTEEDQKNEQIKKGIEKRNELNSLRLKIFEKEAQRLQEISIKDKFLLEDESARLKLLNERIAKEYDELTIDKELLAIAKEKEELAKKQKEHGGELEKSVNSLTAHLLGIHKDSFKNTFLGKLVEGGKLGFSIGNQLSIMGKELGKIITVENIYVGISKKIIQSTVWIAKEQEEAISSFNKATGAGGEYNDMLRDIGLNNLELGIDTGMAVESLGALRSNFVGFTRETEETQKELTILSSTFSQMGISSETFASNLQIMTKSLGLSTNQAIEAQREIATTAKILGVNQAQMAQAFTSAGPKLAAYGEKGIAVFRKLAVQAKNTGLEMDKIIGIAEQFDTFEGAAESVARLNAILGGPYLDSMQMLAAEDPAEQFRLLKNSLDASGMSFDNMTKFQRKAVAAAAGMDVAELGKMMAAGLDEQSDAARVAAREQEEFNKVAEASRSVMRDFQLIINSAALSVGWLVDWIKIAMKWFLEANKYLRGGIFVILGLIFGAFTVAKMIKFFRTIKEGFTGVAKGSKEVGKSLGEGLGKGISSVGEAIKNKAADFLAFGLTILMIGAGIGIVIASFALLAISMKDLTVGQMLAFALVVGVIMVGLYLLIPAIIAAGVAAAVAGVPLLVLGAAVLMIGAGIGIVIASFALLAISMKDLTVGQMLAFALVVGVIMVGLYLLIPAIIAAGVAAAVAGVPLLVLGAAVLMIGAGIGIVIASFALLVSVITNFFTILVANIDNLGTFAISIGGLALSMGALAISAPFAALGIGLIAFGFGALAVALGLISTKDLQAVSSMFTAITGITGETSAALKEVTTSVKDMAKAMDAIPSEKAIQFTSIIENVRKLAEQGTRVVEARETVKNTLMNTVSGFLGGAGGGVAGAPRALAAAGGGVAGAPRALAAAGGERTIIIQLGDRVLKKFVLDVLNDEMAVRKIY